MALNQYDANCVLQLTEGYLETVIRRYMATQSNHCLHTRGVPIQIGDGPYVQAEYVTYEFTNVTFREDDSDVVADSTIAAIDGTLKSGPDTNSLSEVTDVTVPIPITVDVADNDDTLVVVEVEHPDPREDNPTFEFDLAPLSTDNVSLTLGSDAVSLTVLTDGTLAAGITFDESPSGDLTSFEENYDDSKGITGSDDWALVLDTWTVRQYISEVDLDKNESDLRNTSIDMNGIDSGGIKLDVDGEAKYTTVFGEDVWGGFNADVTATPEVSTDDERSLDIQYTVTDAKLTGGSSLLNMFLNIKKRLENKGQAKGNREMVSPVAFGEESNTAGRFTGTSATTHEDELAVFGHGSRELPDDPSLAVSSNEEALVPACDAGGDPQGTFSVTYEDTDDDLPPVDICQVGVDDEDVALSGNAVNSASTIEPGDTWEYDATYTGSGSGVTTATARIVTNVGVEEVDLRIYRTAGTVEGPESLEFSGETILFSCSCNTHSQAETEVEITNVGNGPVELCTVTFTASGDGSWYLEDDVSGAVLYPDESSRTGVVYDAVTADEWRSATMEVKTTGNDITLDLEAIVHDYEGHGIPPEGEVNCRGPFMPGGETVCLDPDEIYALNQLIRETLEILFDDAPFGGDLDVWDGVLPECGPRMLCVDFLEVSLAGLPTGFEAEFVDPARGPRYHHRVAGGSATMLVPMTGEPLMMEQTVPEAAGAADVSGYVKPWRLQRVGHWEAEGVRDLVAAGDSLLALADDDVTTLSIEDGQPTEVGHFELELPATGLAALGKRFVAYGPQGVQFLGSRTRPGVRPIETAVPLSGLVPVRNADVAGRLAYGVDDEHIRLHDLGDREGFDALGAIDRQLAGEVETAFANGSTLYLAGDGGIEAWDITDVLPRSIGTFQMDQTASVFGGEDMLFALSEDGSAKLLGVDRETGFDHRGRIDFPEEWRPLLPAGQPTLMNGGEYIASRAMDGSGVNVLQPQAAKYPTDPDTVV